MPRQSFVLDQNLHVLWCQTGGIGSHCGSPRRCTGRTRGSARTRKWLRDMASLWGSQSNL